MFRSRWGFHPCDYPTFRKLKLLNQVYWRAIRLAHAWTRWSRKDPHNRVVRRRIRNRLGQTIGYEAPVPVPEPSICPVFSQKVLEKRHVDKKGNVSKEGFLVEKIVMDYTSIPTDYAAARKPAASEVDVKALHPSLAELDDLYEKARQWLEEQDVR